MQAQLVQFGGPGTPYEEHEFSVLITIFSIPPATVSTFLGLSVVDGYNRMQLLRQPLRVMLAGFLTAVGVGITHYTGLISICSSSNTVYSWWMVLVTVVYAVIICSVGMFLFVASENVPQKVVASFVIGGAATSVHFMGTVNIEYHASSEMECPFGLSALGQPVSADVLGHSLAIVATLANFYMQVIVPHSSQSFWSAVFDEFRAPAPAARKARIVSKYLVSVEQPDSKSRSQSPCSNDRNPQETELETRRIAASPGPDEMTIRTLELAAQQRRQSQVDPDEVERAEARFRRHYELHQAELRGAPVQRTQSKRSTMPVNYGSPDAVHEPAQLKVAAFRASLSRPQSEHDATEALLPGTVQSAEENV